LLQIDRSIAGYKACNMLATYSYGWRSILKFEENCDKCSILSIVSARTTKQNLDPRRVARLANAGKNTNYFTFR
jgi:hypothetical protein